MSSRNAFLDALVRRDFDALEASLAPEVLARFLLPRRVEEWHSRAEVRARIEGWFGAATDFAVIDSSEIPIAGRLRLGWRFRLVRDSGPEVIEQVAFIDPGEGGVSRIDMVCSGFLPGEEPAESCAIPVRAGTTGA